MANSRMPIILSAKRTPIGQFNGCFANTSATQLGAIAIGSCIANAQCKTELIDQVIMGCVLSAGLGQAPARQASIAADVPNSVPCTTINKMCGSGMQSIIFAHDAIVSGHSSAVIAGGLENMTQAPYLLKKARSGYRLGSDTLYDHMMIDGLEDAYQPGQPMGYFAEQCVSHYGFTRSQQDEFAIESLARAQQAQKNQLFIPEITPVTIKVKHQEMVVSEDEGPLTVNAEKIPRLRPVFIQDGTITAANASSISDGAAALVIASDAVVEQHSLPAMARIVAHHTHAHEPAWFPTAPVEAIKSVLIKANWTTEEVDLFEINEAFAAVTLVAMKDLNLPHEKVNVHGGACVLGHPVGASGARIVVTLVHALQQKGLQKGVAALCIGGGEATALAIELM